MIPEANLWCVMMDAVSLVQRESVFFWTSLPIQHARNSLVTGKCLTSSHTCLLWVRLLFSRVYTTFLGYTHRHDPSFEAWMNLNMKTEDRASAQLSQSVSCSSEPNLLYFFFGIARNYSLISHMSLLLAIYSTVAPTRAT